MARVRNMYVCICCNCFVLLALKTYSFAKDLPTYILQPQSIVSQTLSFQEDNGMFSGCYVLMYIEFKTVQTEVLNDWWYLQVHSKV